MLFSVAPGQQLFYYGARSWPDDVRKKMYEQFGGSPKDLLSVHDYDPKVGMLYVVMCTLAFSDFHALNMS
jgi:hypothetical protein